MKFLLLCLLTTATTYALFLLLVALFANKLIFPAPKSGYDQGANPIFLSLPDGNKIAAFYLPAKDSKYCVIYSHGNGEDISSIYEILLKFQREGFSVLAYDYLGYGLSSDKQPTPQNLYQASEAAYRYATESLGFKEGQIAAVGYSLGSSAACNIAKNNPNIRALVLVGGFASVPYAVLPVNILPWDILNNHKKLSYNKSVPALIMHGTRDSIVPPRNARINYNSCTAPKRLVWFEDFGHYNINETPRYWDEIKNIIENGYNRDENGIGTFVQ